MGHVIKIKCKDCDLCSQMEWNGYSYCTENPKYTNCTGYDKFILRRDKRSCENCDNSGRPIHEYPCYCCIQKHKSFGNSGYNYHDAWKPRDYNQENKEKEMSYKPTSKMTIRNIAKKIKETGCKDASMKFVEYLCIVGDPNEGTTRVDKKLDKLSRLFTHLTKTNESTEWAIQHSFIEEEISLKPCPSCGKIKPARVVSAKEMHDSELYGDDYSMCCDSVNGGCGLAFGYRPTKKEAIKAWNTRK